MVSLDNDNIKIFFLGLILAFSFKGLAQEVPTYSLSISYTQKLPDTPYIFCHDGYSSFMGKESFYYSQSTEVSYNNLKLSNTFKLTLHSLCNYLVVPGPDYYDCGNGEITNTISASELIKSSFLSAGGCTGSISITDFKPNVNIKNLDTANPNEICAGFKLGLSAFPDGFPDAAYHWQYSLDNIKWTDVLASKNNSAIVQFSIQEILNADGINHINYFDKLIYFRLGYEQYRAFTNPLAIKYSSCAPILKNVTYESPDCNNDNIKKIEVFFDRDLKSNENLFPFYIININPLKNTPRFQLVNPLTSLTKDAETGFYKYTFLTPGILEEKETYRIEYQANSNGNPAGSLQSPQNFNFTYINPIKIQFEITNYTAPSCVGAHDGTIEIKVLSGQEPYHFYKDGVEITPRPTLQNGKYYITGLEAKEYNIMVTDAKGCIEKL